jgi:hypothetical protein
MVRYNVNVNRTRAAAAAAAAATAASSFNTILSLIFSRPAMAVSGFTWRCWSVHMLRLQGWLVSSHSFASDFSWKWSTSVPVFLAALDELPYCYYWSVPEFALPQNLIVAAAAKKMTMTGTNTTTTTKSSTTTNQMV